MTDIEIVEPNPAGGRPPKLTPEARTAALDAIKIGGTRKDAADRAGVDERTLERWLAHGREPRAREPYASFATEVLRAESDAKLLAVGTIKRAMMGGAVLTRQATTRPDGTQIVNETFTAPDPRAAEWYLERRHPREYGRVERVELDVKNRVQQLADELGLPYEMVLAEAQRIAFGSGGLPAGGS